MTIHYLQALLRLQTVLKHLKYISIPLAMQTILRASGDAVSHLSSSVCSYIIRVVASNTNGADDVELTKSHAVTYEPRSMAGFETSGEFFVRVGDGMSFSITANPNTMGNSSANGSSC